MEQKMRHKGGEGAGVILLIEVGSVWVHGDIMADFCEESIDRRSVHLSLDTHVGEQAECLCADTHTPRSLCQQPLNAPWNMPRRCAPLFYFPPFSPCFSSAVRYVLALSSELCVHLIP